MWVNLKWLPRSINCHNCQIHIYIFDDSALGKFTKSVSSFSSHNNLIVTVTHWFWCRLYLVNLNHFQSKYMGRIHQWSSELWSNCWSTSRQCVSSPWRRSIGARFRLIVVLNFVGEYDHKSCMNVVENDFFILQGSWSNLAGKVSKFYQDIVCQNY